MVAKKIDENTSNERRNWPGTLMMDIQDDYGEDDRKRHHNHCEEKIFPYQRYYQTCWRCYFNLNKHSVSECPRHLTKSRKNTVKETRMEMHRVILLEI